MVVSVNSWTKSTFTSGLSGIGSSFGQWEQIFLKGQINFTVVTTQNVSVPSDLKIYSKIYFQKCCLVCFNAIKSP